MKDIGGSYKGQMLRVSVHPVTGRFLPSSSKDASLVRDGAGIMHYEDGSVYEGIWKMGQRQGKGRLIQPNGDCYSGDWRDDKAWGRGKHTNLEGYSHEGQWKEDFQEGFGVELWTANNSKYEGTFSRGQKHG